MLPSLSKLSVGPCGAPPTGALAPGGLLSGLPEDVQLLVWHAIVADDCGTLFKLCQIDTQFKRLCDTDTFWEALVQRLLLMRGETLDLPQGFQTTHKRIYEVLCSPGTTDNKFQRAIMMVPEIADAVQILVSAGANVRNYNDSALRGAVRAGNADVVRILLQNGANPHVYGNRPLKDAVELRHVAVVRVLLEFGANVHADNDEALRMATSKNFTEIVEILLENDADVNAETGAALRMASYYGYADMVELLLKRNANVHADALELARRRGHTAIVKRLEAAMAAAQSESES